MSSNHRHLHHHHRVPQSHLLECQLFDSGPKCSTSIWDNDNDVNDNDNDHTDDDDDHDDRSKSMAVSVSYCAANDPIRQHWVDPSVLAACAIRFTQEICKYNIYSYIYTSYILIAIRWVNGSQIKRLSLEHITKFADNDFILICISWCEW